MKELRAKLERLGDADRARLYRELLDRSDTSSKPVQELVLVYERSPGADPEAIRRTASSRLPEQERPTRFVATDSLPRTPHGKLDRRALPGLIRAEHRATDQLTDGYAISDDVMSSAIATFAEVLGTANVGADSNFFELGGHSLLAVECMLAFEKRTGERISITQFLNHPTPRGMAGLLKDKGTQPFHYIYSAHGTSFDYIYPVSENQSGLPVFVFSSSRLAYALKPRRTDWTIYGVQFRWRDQNDEDIHYRNLEDLAARIAAEIRQLCGEGEFVLAGSSFSAMVTFEVARQLRADGIKPQLTILIEPSLLPGLRTWLELDLDSYGQLREGENPYFRWLLVNNPFRAQFWRRLRDQVSKRRGEPPRMSTSPGTSSESKAFEFGRAGDLRHTYRPSTYNGPSVLLAGASSAWLVCRDWEARLGQNCSLHILDTDHEGILRNPFMSEVVVPIVIAEVDSDQARCEETTVTNSQDATLLRQDTCRSERAPGRRAG